MKYFLSVLSAVCLVSIPGHSLSAQSNPFTPELFAFCDIDYSGGLDPVEFAFCYDENQFGCFDLDANDHVTYLETLGAWPECV